jgi:hypothetical protein
MKEAGILVALAGLLWTFYAALVLPRLQVARVSEALPALAVEVWTTRLAVIGLAVAFLGLMLIVLAGPTSES